MNPNLKTAIFEFIANEFKLDPEAVSLDTDFQLDLGLQLPQVTELLERMQDSLNFNIPEDRVEDITSVGDLIESLESAQADAPTEPAI